MDWMMLTIGAAAVAGGIAAWRFLGGAWRAPSVFAANPKPARAERNDPPHRQVAHYRASGALPRWDP